MGGRRVSVSWRVRAAWKVAGTSPRRALSWIGLYTLLATMVLSVPFGGGSSRGVALALPVALVVTYGVAVWRWSGKIRSVPRPLLDALDGIETDRLVLRRPARRDASAYAATVDSVAMEANGSTEAHLQRRLRQMKLDLAAPCRAELLVTDKATGAVLGDVTVHRRHHDPRTCDLGWSMGPGQRGKGYGTEALRAAFPVIHAVGIRRIVVGTAPDNTAVRRVLEKLGAHQIENRPHQLPNGTTIESVRFAHDAVDTPLRGEVAGR